MMLPGTVFTFYSFKGGVGRSFLLANIGSLLTMWGYKVLCIDWDLEAPGLARIFSKQLGGNVRSGLLELIKDQSDGKDPDWTKYTTDVHIPDINEPMKLIAAGCQNDTYIQRVQELQQSNYHAQKGFGQFLEKLRESWKNAFDVILIDSRTGFTDAGYICTVRMPDVLVLVFASNYQNLEGVAEIARRVKTARWNSFIHPKLPPKMLPIASRIDSQADSEQSREWMNIFQKHLEKLYSWVEIEEKTPELILTLLDRTTVPYYSRWSFGEKLPVLEEPSQLLTTISAHIARIAALIALNLKDSDLFVSNSETYIERARSEAANPPCDICLSSPPDETGFSEQLVKRLVKLNKVVRLGVSTFEKIHPDSEEVASSMRNAKHYVAIIPEDLGDSQRIETAGALKRAIDQLWIEKQAPGKIIFIQRSDSPETKALLRKSWSDSVIYTPLDGNADEIAIKIEKLIRAPSGSGDGAVNAYADALTHHEPA